MKKRSNSNVENIAYKFRAYPSDDQKHIFACSFGCKRFLYNTMLSDETYHYEQMGKSLHNEVSDYKEDYPFLCEVDSLILANAKLALDNAFQRFFSGNGGYPVFKKKSSRQSFTTNCSCKTHPNLKFDEKRSLVKLPKMKEWLSVKAHRHIKQGGILKSATVSKEPNGEYYISLLYEYPNTVNIVNTVNTVNTDNNTLKPDKSIGLDMSVGHFYVDSNGEFADMPKFYRLTEAFLAKEQAKLSHMTKGSKNYLRQKRKIAKLHAKIKRQRSDFLHKLSYYLVRTYDIICIEDLSVKGMSQSLNLGKSVHDLGWSMFVNMLEYKCKRYGKILIKVDRFYPSSKTCCKCGNIKSIGLSERLYDCPICGSFIDRDWNAAINIHGEGLRIYKEQSLLTA